MAVHSRYNTPPCCPIPALRALYIRVSVAPGYRDLVRVGSRCDHCGDLSSGVLPLEDAA